LFCFNADRATAADIGHPSILDLPAHRLGQEAGHALNRADMDDTVGVAAAVIDAAPAPRKMAAARRIAGAKLHAVEFLAIVCRSEIGADVVDNVHDFSRADDVTDFF